MLGDGFRSALDRRVQVVAPLENSLPDEKLKELLTCMRAHLESLYGERLIRILLFGSHARGEARGGSDIDVLIVLRGPVDPGEEIERTGAFTAGLCLRYGVVISRLFVAVDRFEHEQSPVLMNARREGVPV